MKAQKLYDDIRNITQLVESCEAMWDRLKETHDAPGADNADHDTLAKRLPEQEVRAVWVNFQDLLGSLRRLDAAAREDVYREKQEQSGG